MKRQTLDADHGTRRGAPTLPIDWAVAFLNLPGQTESGDQFVVAACADGVLVGVVDGLGHGEKAAAAAKIALKTLAEFADEQVDSLIRRCHDELRRTRGVVMSLAMLNASENTVTWSAVGNVMAVIQRFDSRISPPREYILQGGGVVGDRLPQLRTTVCPIRNGDLLILATDGIGENFIVERFWSGDLQGIADRILSRYAKGNDEALVLVVRYRGSPS